MPKPQLMVLYWARDRGRLRIDIFHACAFPVRVLLQYLATTFHPPGFERMQMQPTSLC